jgi:HK97 family phage major capsid protein
MSSTLDALTNRRAGLIKESTELAQKGVTEGRNLTADEATKFDAMVAEIEALDNRSKAILEGEQRARDIEASFTPTGKREEDRDGKQGAFGQWAREARNGDQFDVERTPGAEQRAVDLYSGRSEKRDMSATGGISKTSVYSQLWEYAVAGSQILQSGVTIINTADGNTIPMPRVTVHATGASAAAGANITASDATIDTVDLSVIKRGYITYVPSELLQDATFDIEGYLSRAAGRELGKIIGSVASTAAIAGYTVSGAVGPTGSASGTLGAQATALQGADLLITLFHSVLPEYRTNGSWIFSDTVAALLRRLKDSTGQYVWQNSLVSGDPDRILGKPVFIDSNLPSWTGTPATDSATKPIYFGDLSSLTVRIAGGLRFERSNDVAFAKDAVAFRALVRTGAAVLDANAAKFFVFS